MSSTQQVAEEAPKETLDLKLDLEEVKGELALTDPAAIHAEAEADPELEAKARQFADALTAVDPEHVENHYEAKRAVEEMGRALQTEAAHRSKMLQQPIRALSEHGGEGGPVAKSLIDLKLEVEALDPARFDFSPGWLSRMLGYLPGVGTPVKRYFTKFESSQTVIDAIIKALENGREQLKRDNVTLREDQRAMRELTQKIERQIKLGQLVDQHLEYKLSREIQTTDPRQGFVQEELLFPLRQRIMDLQQQLAVNQQGVLATAMVMRNNTELVRGVNRALDVTVSALQVAVTVALALANQKMVLDKVSAINEATSSLISGTAERLRTQGTEIHKQAAGAMIDLDALKQAFADINAAMDEISKFRQAALPQMASTILEFDELTAKGEEAVRRFEAGEQARPSLRLDLD
jgi:uncharacterized protein YaaN involved in tellurite resistance